MKRPLRVEWNDHFSQQGWTDASDLKPVIVTSFGIPLRENKEVLVLAQNATYETGVAGSGNVIVIMKKCIISSKVMK